MRHRGRGARASPWEFAPENLFERTIVARMADQRDAWRAVSGTLPSNWWRGAQGRKLWVNMVRVTFREAAARAKGERPHLSWPPASHTCRTSATTCTRARPDLSGAACTLQTPHDGEHCRVVHVVG